MKGFSGILFLLVLCIACDDQRVYEKNVDFPSRNWVVSEHPAFEFEIDDTIATYNLYGNVRNSLDYPFSRIFVNYSLTDSAGNTLNRRMIGEYLFDEKTGKPFGESGLGDIYHHRLPLETGFRFPHSGRYVVTLEQYMRRDSLHGVLAVGLRVERAQ